LEWLKLRYKNMASRSPSMPSPHYKISSKSTNRFKSCTDLKSSNGNFRNPRFVTVFTRFLEWSVFWPTWLQTMSSHCFLNMHFNIII
jgi:hypothetical protein